MEPSNETLALLDQLPMPVFLVKDKVITHINQAAQPYSLTQGMSVSELIYLGKSEYDSFEEGRLLLTLQIENQLYNSSVVKIESFDLFCLESVFQNPELKILALAAQNLRDPLSCAMVNIEKILPSASIEASDELKDQIAQLNRNLYQLHRIVGNMSDAAIYNFRQGAKKELCEAVAFVAEIVKKVATLTEATGIRIELDLLNKPVFCQMDTEMVERSVLNLLSNAIKFSPKDSTIRVSMTSSNEKLYIKVQNGGIGNDRRLQNDFFSRFLREPGLDDSRTGIGLGMTFVRGTAAAHGGVVLIEQPAGEGLRFTMSFSLAHGNNISLHSPVALPVDYTGGYDHALIELSDLLPPALFK